MDSTDSQTVLALGHDAAAAASLEATSDGQDRPVSVRAVTDLGSLYDELCLSVVHCLLLPAEVEGTPALEVARGVDALFPDLPVVVAGLAPSEVPDDLDVRAVPSADLTDDDVAAAVGDALAGPTNSHAAREPSRLETLLLSMFDQFPIHLYAKDEAARHVMVSRHASEPTDLVGITDLDYVELPREHREAAYRDDMRTIEEEDKILNLEEYTDYIDSHTLTTKVPWYDEDGEVVGLVGVTRDITERKQREQAARRQQELLVKLALLSAHEFRNELQVALGRLELVEDDPSQIEVIEQSHDHLIEIVDKIVELASQEQQTREASLLWLSKLCREVWDTLSAGDATLVVGEDDRIVADPESLSLFLQILFDNSIEHAGEDVTVTVGATDDGFYVADDGPGLDESQPDRVFDAGFTTAEENTGFGLFVARSIAHEHNWQMSVSDSASGGLRFDVSGLQSAEDAGTL